MPGLRKMKLKKI